MSVINVRNPYNPKHPSSPDLFVGRNTNIKSFKKLLEEALATKKPSSIVILGDWGIGKSSLLLKLKSILEKRKNTIGVRISLPPPFQRFFEI